MIDPSLPERNSGSKSKAEGNANPTDYGTVSIGALTDEELGVKEANSELGSVEGFETLDPEANAGEPDGPLPGSHPSLARFTRNDPLVVLVSPTEVEVLAPRSKGSDAQRSAGHSRLIQFSHDLPLGRALASFIVATLKEHGVGRRSIRLALSHGILPAKIIDVPSLPLRDLQQVIARRTAAAVDLRPEDVTFSAMALDGPDLEERRWLVHPIEAKPLVAMQTELRSLGWPVKDIVPARTAPFLSVRGTNLAGEGRATVVIVFDGDAAAIGLVSRGRLAHLSTLPGTLDAHINSEHVRRALVQELRGVDAFWRRSSRGDQVTDILILGAVRSALDTLAPAIRSALGDVRVSAAISAMPFEAQGIAWLDRAPLEARIDLLRSLRAPRVALVDLSLPLRPRARTIAAVALSSLVVCSTVAMGLRAGMNGMVASISTEARVVRAASSDLEALIERRDRIVALESRLHADCEELQQLQGLGMNATPIFEGLRSAFGDRTRLLSVRGMGSAVGGATVSQGLGEIGALHIRGVVVDEPGVTAATLGHLRAALLRVPGVVNVVIELPNLNDQGPADSFGPGSRGLRFLATTRLVPVGAESSYGLALPVDSVGSQGGPEALPGGE